MFLLRHGQSLFNLLFTATRRDPGIEDPELTALGRQQAQAAAAALAERDISLVIVSPYTRALQTAAPILAACEVPVVVMHEVGERAAFACDVGRRPDVLAAQFPAYQFSHLPEVWWPQPLESEAAIISRANAFRTNMAKRDDSDGILLVSHWAFILALTGVSLENGAMLEYDPKTPGPREIIWRH